jgi:putative flippase GtrA
MEQLKKFFTREVIFYLIFGVLTTVVNIAVSFFLTAFCNVEGNLASTIGIICCILFAYFTNRKWVFNSTATTLKEKWIEFIKFILGRAVTAVLEIISVFLLNNIIHSFYGMFSDDIAYLINKCLITVVIIILNFFISKFFAFKK